VKVLFDRCEASLVYYPVVIELIRRGDAELARTVVRRELEKADDGWHRRHGPAPRGEGQKAAKTPREGRS
jgi:hypothetical protein